MLNDAVTSEVTDVFTFTARELARLAIYRAAVQAGFYNEGFSPLPYPSSVGDCQEHSNGLGTDLL
jgi:hypothetical protein